MNDRERAKKILELLRTISMQEDERIGYIIAHFSELREECAQIALAYYTDDSEAASRTAKVIAANIRESGK